jgi:NAD(P)-dependent dehydrogenase (short-subunit alcohol dehydrogenase family)
MPFRTTVITGATSGIGKETALALAKKDHALYLLVRNTEKGEELKKELVQQTGNRSVFVVHCDLADLQSVKEATDQLKGKLFAINTLINNAGGINSQRQVSKDGNELTFAMNHLGHFLLTLNLMPLLEKGQARIINVSSEAHKMGKVLMLNDVQFKVYSAFGAYALAKLCNIWFAKALSERYGNKGVTAYALHPGVVKTGFGSELGGLGKIMMLLAKPFMITPQQGAQTSIFLASEVKLSPKLSGQYFKKMKVAQTNLAAQNTSARNKLWQISEQLVGPFLNS